MTFPWPHPSLHHPPGAKRRVAGPPTTTAIFTERRVLVSVDEDSLTNTGSLCESGNVLGVEEPMSFLPTDICQCSTRMRGVDAAHARGGGGPSELTR